MSSLVNEAGLGLILLYVPIYIFTPLNDHNFDLLLWALVSNKIGGMKGASLQNE